jgi:hypothetical protein
MNFNMNTQGAGLVFPFVRRRLAADAHGQPHAQIEIESQPASLHSGLNNRNAMAK